MFLLLLVAVPARAQLLEDSKAKLKSEKVKKEKGFLFFKKKGKSVDPPSNTPAKSAPRYSSAKSTNRFRNIRQSTPRYSKSQSFKNYPRRTAGVPYSRPVSWKGTPMDGNAKYSRPVSWKGTPMGGNARYSRPVSWKGANKGGGARYSKPVNWKGTVAGGTPRYSRPVNWKGTSASGSPRYSRPVKWAGTNAGGPPRYSQPVSWRGTKYGGTPRYSQPVNWRGAKIGGTPRYSKPVSWRGTPSIKAPRYSKPVSWRGTPYGGTPRYSRPVSWKGAYPPPNPRYSTWKNRFVIDKNYARQMRPYNPGMAAYQGDIKFKKPPYKNMHPSVNYLRVKSVPNKTIRKAMRKWSVFWIRINSGKVQPKGTRKFAKKPKFDKKERDIWAKPRDKEKPSTRRDTSTQAETGNEDGGNE